MAAGIDSRRLAAEGIVIVVSILLALAGDAWWDGRGEAELRTALLDGLSSDFTLTHTDLSRVNRGFEQSRAAAERILIMTAEGGRGGVDGPTIDSLLYLVVRGGSFDAPQGTLQAALAGGGIAALRDPDLAARLTAWPGYVADLEREQLRLHAKLEEFFAFLRGEGIDTSYLFSSGTPWGRRTTEAYRVVDSSECRSLLSDLWHYYRLLAEKTGVALGALEQIRPQLPEVEADL